MDRKELDTLTLDQLWSRYDVMAKNGDVRRTMVRDAITERIRREAK